MKIGCFCEILLCDDTDDR